MSNLSFKKFPQNWEYPHLLLDVVYRDYPLCEIESGLIRFGIEGTPILYKNLYKWGSPHLK